MEITLELIANEVYEFIKSTLLNKDININQIIQKPAVSALCEIQQCLKDDSLSDFDVVEEIVNIFEKYHISAGTRHDFG